MLDMDSNGGYPLGPAMAAKEAAADLPTMATQVLALAARASTDGNLMPSGWNVPKGQMQGPSDTLPSGFQLTAPLLNSFPSLESHNTQCYLPRASTVSAGGLCCGSPSLTPRAVGNKPPKVTGSGSPTTSKRCANRNFTCKICQHLLPGDNFYERHLQCISCQMAINCVARNMKVQHLEAKTAYIQAVQAATPEQIADLENFRMELHMDAAQRIKNGLGVGGQQAAGSGLPVSENQAICRRRRRTVEAVNNDADAPGASPRRRRTGTAVKGTAQPGIRNLIHETPCHGLLMLLKACRNDLDEMEASKERC